MTVRELIKKLSVLDPNAVVMVRGYEYGLCDLDANSPRKARFHEFVYDEDWAGPNEECEAEGPDNPCRNCRPDMDDRKACIVIES